MPSSDTQPADTDAHVDNDPSVLVRRSQSELRLLETGDFSDFTIICGDREWKVHKAIISKVPYFNATVGGGFKEAVQEKITIEEFFEPFEIQWLLAYIYFHYLNADTARHDTTTKSYLETCVRLWHLGDYFHVEGLEKLAKDKLDSRCARWRRYSSVVDTAEHGTTFLVDLESAIRQAWREDLTPGPLRAVLTNLCVDFAPYLRCHPSFFTLLQELPQFAVTFSQQALWSITSILTLPASTRVKDSKLPRSKAPGPPPRLSDLYHFTMGVVPTSARAREHARSAANARRIGPRNSIPHISLSRSGEASESVSMT